ncbi:hypothetical protein [Methylobacterium sp. Leaf123]|uniref:hypothetical protein n=1 Tax=Methylobacterium sp. Leaf123 TaxID=1736264 RepID=UPI000701D288|nr:hypothetical protein [Methylobacterium sp. Leaf123]
MGVVLTFPPRLGCQLPKPSPKSPPALDITDDPPGTPAEEFRLGLSEGLKAAHWFVDSQTEFLRLARARQAGRLEFLRSLQTCSFVGENAAAASAPLRRFEEFIYGARSGGIHGPYAAGHRAAFALTEQFVARLH